MPFYGTTATRETYNYSLLSDNGVLEFGSITNRELDARWGSQFAEAA